MLGFRSYWRELFRLLRGAADNPLVRAGAPWRSGWALGLFAGAQVLAAATLFAHSTHRFAVAVKESGGQWNLLLQAIDAVGFRLVMVMLGCLLFAYPVNLLAFASRWRERRRLEDLVITPLSPREMAFGSVFWACVLGSLGPLVCGLLLALMFGATVLLPLVGGFGPLPSGFHMQEDMFFAVAAVACTPFALAGALKLWFYKMRQLWSIVFTGPLNFCFHLLVAVLFSVFVVGFIEESTSSWWLDEWAGLAIICLVFAAFGIAYLRSAGKLAPSLFIRSVDMTEYLRESFIANDAYRYYHKELRRPIRLRLRQVNRVPWLASLAIVVPVAAATILLVPLGFNTGTVDAPVEMQPTVHNIVTHVFIYALSSLLLFHWLSWRSPGRRLPLVSGAPFEGLLRMSFPLMLAFLVAIAVSGYGALYHPFRRMPAGTGHMISSLLFLAYSAAIVLVVVATTASVFAARGWRRWLRTALFAGVIAGLLMIFRERSNFWYPGSFWNPPASRLAGPLIGMMAILLFCNIASMIQSLYQREVRGLPFGVSNIDPPDAQSAG